MIPGMNGINSFTNLSQYPWVNNPLITDAWIAEKSYLNFQTGVSSWAPHKGKIPLIQATTTAQPTAALFGPKNLSSILFDGVGMFLTGDALAAKMAGTNLPFTVIFSFEFTAAPPSGAKHFMFFGHNADLFSYHGYYVNSTRTFSAQRQRTVAGGAVNISTTQTLTVGNRYVLTYLYTGSNLTVRMNQVTTSLNNTACLAGGPVLSDNFTLAAVRQAGTAPTVFNNFKMRSLVFAPSVLGTSDYLPTENYLMSEI